MKLLSIVLGLSIFQQAAGQDSICVVRQYENDKPITKADSYFYKLPNVVYVTLDEGFNDSILVTVNDTVVLNEYLKTNASIGLAGGFVIHFDDACEIKDLKITFVKANYYIHERVKPAYKSLRVSYLNTWHLIYTNRIPMRE